MKCELCGKSIHDGEVVCGYKHGEVDNIMEVFVPARDSAWMVICNKCSQNLYQIIYSDLKPTQYRMQQ
jgi:hypothetical protein